MFEAIVCLLFCKYFNLIEETPTATSESMLHQGLRPLVEKREEILALFREEKNAV